MQIFIMQKIKIYELIVAMNVIIAGNSFLKKKDTKGILKIALEFLALFIILTQKNLISFQDSFNAKGDLPFLLYFDFETTAPTDNCFDPEQKKNVCCVLCFNCWFSSCVKFK